MNKLILKTKNSLIDKARRSGLYENFGEAESNMLRDKLKYNPYGSPDERQTAAQINEFENWCMNYTGK